jgi:single-strand DNA-binding protein
MRSTNLFIVRGHVGAEPKTFGKIVKLSVATNRYWKDARGERREETDWVTLTFLNEKIADFVAKNVKKGDPIYAECRVAEGSYTKDGVKYYTTDIVVNTFDLLSPKATDGDE